jgi:helix-turn-helix protein
MKATRKQKAKQRDQQGPIPPSQLQGRGALKLKAASRYLSVHPITVRRLVQKGLLKPNTTTRHLLFPITELNRFLAQ